MKSTWIFAFLGALLSGILIQPTESRAQGFDPCPRLVEAHPAHSSSNSIRLLWDWFNETKVQEEQVYSEQKYFFTVKPGRFVNVRCDDHQFEEQEMYPIGLMVRPIAHVPLPIFEEAREDRAILVMTEYGQRKLIKESDIAPIVDNAIYLFSDVPGNAGICRESDNCPGSSLERCERRTQCRYVISARYGYAIASDFKPSVRSTIAAYKFIKNASTDRSIPDFMISEDQQTRIQSIEDVACKPFPVKAYKAGGESHQPRDSYYSLCAERRKAGSSSNAVQPIKFVTLASAKKAFEWQLDGSFHRRFNVPSTGQSTNLTRALTDYRITSVKECGVEIKDVGKGSISGGLKATLSAGILEIGAGAEANISTEVTRTLSKDDYLLMSTYFIDPIVNAPDVSQQDKENIWFFRVVFRSKCEDGTPKSATSIIIHYHRLDGQVLEVRVSDDLRKSYLEAWSEYGYISDNSANALREGHFWTVPDLDGYFIWRDTLRNFIEEQNPVTSRLLARHPKSQREHVRDFFVHLMLAAAFNHRDPTF